MDARTLHTWLEFISADYKIFKYSIARGHANKYAIISFTKLINRSCITDQTKVQVLMCKESGQQIISTKYQYIDITPANLHHLQFLHSAKWYIAQVV